MGALLDMLKVFYMMCAPYLVARRSAAFSADYIW
jgi:hypothetical protein